MGIANTGRAGRAARFHGGSDSAADATSSFDAATRSRIQLVCDFVNAEVARWRNQLIGVGIACLVGMIVFPIVTRIVDARVPVVIAAGIVGFWFYRARRELASSYRKIATKRLIAATSKALTYKPASSLTREQFVSLDIFPQPGKGWETRHEIGGRAGNVAFSLHAVNAPGIERGTVAFRGVLIRLEFATTFPGHTVVFPESQGIAAPSSNSGAKRDLVLVKNPEFEQMFSAYSTDYSQARQLITPDLMALLISAPEMFGPDIRLAFLRRSLFVAVPNAMLLPEISLMSAKLMPEDATGQMVRLVAFADKVARAVGST
jgi:hypothetical protein